MSQDPGGSGTGPNGGLGAALENLVLAADAEGYTPHVRLLPDGADSSHVARIELARSSPRASALYAQIPKRHTKRYPYVQGKDVPAAALSAMAGLADTATADARLFWFTGSGQRRQVGELLVATLPFAVLTWWSVATPLIGMLLLALGATALRVGSGRVLRKN